ncbi:MFS transporter [Demequina rhizosphaerae]|uniref:MFS transporter n=1 Tax=Demequina rhizosphaerae TaxID=1638985 RepID=UPI000781AF13|nr:MFS transporter [Demequina rhizosphaerae]
MTHDHARVAAARRGVLAIFWIMGVYMATMVSRYPTITELLDISTGELARLLLFGALGALCALLVTGWSVARFGTRALLWWWAWGHLVAFSLMGAATAWGSQALFAVASFLVSFAFAFTNVSMNAEAAEVEREMGRAVMPQFHASFSVGLAMGLALGAGISHLGVAPVWHFVGVAVALTAARLAVLPAAVLDGAPRPDDARPGLGGPFAAARDEYRDRRVVLIGVIVFSAATVEGAAAQWASLAVVEAFDQPEAVGDLLYWLFVVAMVSVRWWGAAIIGRLGRVVALRMSAVLVAAGVTMFALAPGLWLVPAAMVLWGLGAALGVPIGFSAASDDPRRAAARVAAVSSFSTIAGLVMPQVIGHLGDVVELRVALLVVVAAALLSFVLARAVRSEGPLFRSRRALARRERAAAMEAEAERDAAAAVLADGVEPVQALPEEGAPTGPEAPRS